MRRNGSSRFAGSVRPHDVVNVSHFRKVCAATSRQRAVQKDFLLTQMHRWHSIQLKDRVSDCEDFCGDLSCISANPATTPTNSGQLANCLAEKGLQGFLPSVQQLS